MISSPGRIIFWIFLSGAIAYALISSWAGFAPYRDQHLGTARLMAVQGICLENCQIIGFNANQIPTMQEIPLWQAGTAWALRIFAGWDGAANLFSLLAFSLGLWPLYQVSFRFLGKEGAWWCLAAFLAHPVVFYYSGCASPDGFSISAALWAYEASRRFALRGGWWWGMAALFCGILAALLKPPFYMVAGLALVFGFGSERVKSLGIWLRLGITGLGSAVAFLAWTSYTNRWLDQALWPLVDLRLSQNPEMYFWYFGDWAYRLDPANWIKAGWRFGNSIFGSFVLGGVMVAGFFLRPSREGWAWLAGAVAVTAVFTHLVLHHSHYFLMFAPATALALGGVLDWVFRGPTLKSRLAQAGGCLLVGLSLGGSLLQGSVGREVVLQFDPYPRKAAETLRQHTSAQDRLLIVGGGWGGNLLLLSERKGLSIWNTRFLEEPQNLQLAKDLGFTRLVVVQESPLLTALQRTNPGGARYTAPPFSHYLSPLTEQFPLVYEDEQLLIRSIPAP